MVIPAGASENADKARFVITGTGVLAVSRESEVYVGATINSIPVNLPAGQYRQNVTIEVVY